MLARIINICLQSFPVTQVEAPHAQKSRAFCQSIFPPPIILLTAGQRRSSTALNITVETLKEEGWGIHIFAMAGLVCWVALILGMWLLTIAAFENACPMFLVLL